MVTVRSTRTALTEEFRMRRPALVGRVLLMLATVCAATVPIAASAASQPEGVVVINACQHRLSSDGLVTDGQYTVSVNGDLFEISESTPITSMMGVSGISWARWDTTHRYYSYSSQSFLSMTCEGDLQFWHARGILLWDAHSGGLGGTHLIINNAGELRLYNADWSRIVWRSWSGQRYLPAGTSLPSGGRLASGGADHYNYTLRTLYMQSDGNLVYRVGGVVRWQSGTHVTGAYATVNTRGQLLVVAHGGVVVWSSRATASREAALDVEFMKIWDYSSGIAHSVWQAPGVS